MVNHTANAVELCLLLSVSCRAALSQHGGIPFIVCVILRWAAQLERLALLRYKRLLFQRAVSELVVRLSRVECGSLARSLNFLWL